MDTTVNGGSHNNMVERAAQSGRPLTMTVLAAQARVQVALARVEPEVNVRHAILTFALVLLAVPVAVEAQQAGRLFRIGYLSPDSGPSLYSEAFRQGLRDLGWVEGQNIAIEYRWADQKRDRLPELAQELVRRPVYLIFASTTQGALAAKGATKTIPIVIPVASDPVASGSSRASRDLART